MLKSPMCKFLLMILPFTWLDGDFALAGNAEHMSVEALIALKKVRSAHVSPTGQHIAYRLSAPPDPYNSGGQPAIELHVIDVQGQPTTRYSGSLQVGAVAWSADGKQLLFTGQKANAGATGLYSLSVVDGTVSSVTSLEVGVQAIFPSPDGALIAYLAVVPESAARTQRVAQGFDAVVYEEAVPETKVWLLDTATGISTLQDVPGSVTGFAWRPDSQSYAVSLAPTGTADDDELSRDLVIVDAANSGRLKRLGMAEKLGDFAWSPDGKNIAYIGGEDDMDPNPGRLFVISLDTFAPISLLTNYAGQVEDFHWLDNKRIGYIGSRGVWTEYAITSSQRPAQSGSAPESGPILRALSAGPGTVVAVADTPAHPPEVYRLQLGMEPQRLTFSNPGLEGKTLARQSVANFTARDGLALETILVHPITATSDAPSPLIVFAHSGPEAHYANGWLSSYHTPAQHLAAEGYLLAFPNYRGSTGRGVSFSKLSQNDPAGAEFDDLVDTKKYLVAAGLADTERTGIAGFSYGGYAAMWGATAQTGHFSAAVSLAGMSNYVSNFGSTDIPNEWFQMHARVWPWDDWQHLLKRSPVFYAGETQTPILIASGDSDRRFDPSQSLEMYRHIKLRTETPVRMVVYPGEGHGIGSVQAQLDYALRLVRWMNHYLQDSGDELPPPELQDLAIPAEYDIVIRHGTLLDGTGAAAFAADIAIRDGRIVEIGTIDGKGAEEIDATGRHVSPGWIDMMDQSGETLLVNGLAENKLLMGVTSAFGGEGGTPVPAAEIPGYFRKLEQQGISLNFGSYYNAFQAREFVVGNRDVDVSDTDIECMKGQVQLAMQAGVVGMSSAAFYAPASFMSTHELVELAKVVASHGGIYAAHMRDESRHLLAAIDEMLLIGEQAGLPVEIFHFKNASAAFWGVNTRLAIEKIESARKRGIDIGADQYPYIAGGSGIDATVPTWVFAEGSELAYERLRKPEIRERLKRETEDPESDRMVANSGGWKNIVLLSAFSAQYEEYEGLSFEEIGSALNKHPADVAWDILLEALPARANALYFLMSEPDVQEIMRQPWVSIGSDAGTSLQLGRADKSMLPHPRAYGTFPRVLRRYVRELKLLSLEEAVRKMTSLPASRMQLADRGEIKHGYWADLVIFDADEIQDEATWTEPLRTPSGIDYVIVNGVVVADHGVHTGETPGQILRGPAYRAVVD